jgi:serine/threonine-protein kinase
MDELPAMHAQGPLPGDFQGWNWGAFLLRPVWASYHGVSPGMVILLGVLEVMALGLIPAVYLGIRGNQIAWTRRRFESAAQFRKVERAWARAGILVYLLAAIGFLLRYAPALP